MVFGFPSIRLQPPHKKAHIESPLLPSPLPLPRPARWCAQIASAVFKLASLSLPRATLMVPCAIIVPASAHLRISAYSRLILRRGRRPRRPASFLFHASGGAISHPDGRTRRGWRPRRPASFFFHASGGDISRSGATSFCPRRQKDARTPPKTNGFWISFHPIAAAPQKVPQRIAPAPIPAAAPAFRSVVPHPTAVEQCCGRFSTL